MLDQQDSENGWLTDSFKVHSPRVSVNQFHMVDWNVGAGEGLGCLTAVQLTRVEDCWILVGDG